MIYLFIILGFCLWSFGKVIIDSEENPKHILTWRSSCDNCHHKLQALDLIPVFSRLVNFWRCRYCSQKISPIYIRLEFICWLVFGIIYYFWWFAEWQVFIFARSVIMIMYWDFKSQMINLLFLWLLTIVAFWIPSIDEWLVATCMIGMIWVYILWYIVNRFKTKIFAEGMWMGDVLLSWVIWLYYIYISDILTYASIHKLTITNNFGEMFSSQIISNIYIFMIWIVISSIYWLLWSIIYIYSSANNSKSDKNNQKNNLSQIPFWPALILWFLTVLFL